MKNVVQSSKPKEIEIIRPLVLPKKLHALLASLGNDYLSKIRPNRQVSSDAILALRDCTYKLSKKKDNIKLGIYSYNYNIIHYPYDFIFKAKQTNPLITHLKCFLFNYGPLRVTISILFYGITLLLTNLTLDARRGHTPP